MAHERPQVDPSIPTPNEYFEDYVSRRNWDKVVEFCANKVIEMVNNGSLPHIHEGDLTEEMIKVHCKDRNGHRASFCKLAFKVNSPTPKEIDELSQMNQYNIISSNENSPALVQLEKYLLVDMHLEFRQSTDIFYKPGEHPLP